MITVGKHYRLNESLCFEHDEPFPEGAICRVIGMAVYTDTFPHDELTTLEFKSGRVATTYFADDFLEPMEDCNE